ncbi:hypothetical protein TALC_00794 [Thermoplasmatales archaeon BRNA1]|nr:hypothetical protein TALC_00794 [Thermoplasmatales archaeon BRNA1]
MTSFDDLCSYLEGLDKQTFAAVMNKKSADVLNALTALSGGTSAINTYLHFILASVAADGVLTEEEFLMLKPMFDTMADGDVGYEKAKEMFNQMGLSEPEVYQEIVDTMVDIIGMVSEETKDDIVMLCLMTCAMDGHISEKEKDWIKQLVAPIVPPMEFIDAFLNEAKTFVLATADGDQPRMRVLGLKLKLDGKLYFAVGTFKDVYKQLQANPRCEILASSGMEFLRWDGKAVFTDDARLLPIVENMMPDLVKMYNQMGWKLGFFTLEGGSAEVVNVNNTKKKIF